MTAVSFVHVANGTLHDALPPLLEDCLTQGQRVVVVCSAERLEALNTHLWVYQPDSFLPHGTAADGALADQPIALVSEEINPNNASVLVMLDGAPTTAAAYQTVLVLFADNTAPAMRLYYKACQQAGYQVSYRKLG